MAKDILLDQVLFGNISNLVNKLNPFGLYPTPEDGMTENCLAAILAI